MQEHSFHYNAVDYSTLTESAILLLRQLISIPSFSREEEGTASVISIFLKNHGIEVHQHLNNIWAVNKNFDARKPTILLNSHHDTVRPNTAYSLDPFLPVIEDGKLFGLGSNDAGGCLVSLLATFVYFFEHELKYNLVIAATAEEEISGYNGIECLLKEDEFAGYLTGEVCAIVGEPTLMEMAVAEKGLMVLDCISHGIAGHAARDEGDNAIYHALSDIQWFNTFRFPKVSDFLGPVKMSVTSIETKNKTHNIVPPECSFIVDIRINELYQLDEVLAIIKSNVTCELKPRSIRLRSSAISTSHPLVEAGKKLGRKCYGSPTTSDKALMPFPALKMGPGYSGRSHAADEFIYLAEINNGVGLYIDLLKQLL